MRLSRLGTVLLLGSVILSSCSSAEGSPDSSSENGASAHSSAVTDQSTEEADVVAVEPTSAEPSATASDEVKASPKPFEQRVEAMMAKPVQGFGYDVSVDGTSLMSFSGFHDAPKVRWEVKGQVVDPTNPKEMRVRARSVGEGLWMQMADWPADMKGCWLSLPGDSIPVGLPGMRRIEPIYISLLPLLKFVDTGDEPNTFRVTLALKYVAALMSSSNVRAPFAELKRADGAIPVPVTIEFDTKGFTGLTLEGTDVKAALTEAHVEMDALTRTTFEWAVFEVSYFDWKRSTRVETPPKRLTVSQGSPGCHPGPSV